MKKIFGLIAAFMLLSSCDDGDMTFQTFNFTGTPAECSIKEDTYIITNGSEALILDLSANPLVNIESERNEAGEYIPENVLVAAGKIEYRVYNTDVTSAQICTLLGTPTLTMKEQWLGSGNLEIVTTRTVSTTGVVTYNHSITIVDVSFKKGDETIRIQDNYFGNIQSTLGVTFNFANPEENNPLNLSSCTVDPSKKFILGTTRTPAQALIFQFARGTFDNTSSETEFTISLNNRVDTTANNITVKVYSSSGMTVEGICSGNIPITPVELKRWVATEGTIRIKRSLESGVYNYDIYLDTDVIFYNRTDDNSEFFSPEPNFPTSTSGYEDYYYLGRVIN